MVGSHTEAEVAQTGKAEAQAELVETGLDYTFRRTESDYPLPENFAQTPPVLPDPARCAELLGGLNDVQ